MTSKKIVTLREIAAQHKIEPKRLRALLRTTGKRAKGRWEWKENDPFLAKIAELLKAGKEAKKQ